MSSPTDPKAKSYAQVAAPGPGQSSTDNAPPPPPYTAGANPPPGQSHGHTHPGNNRGQWHGGRSNVETQPLRGNDGDVVLIIPQQAFALARARRRFFGALFWALMIYLVIGVLFGDYATQSQRRHRPHRGKDGRVIIHEEKAAEVVFETVN